jgi:CRISPR-associated endoribonuclease Cas6
LTKVKFYFHSALKTAYAYSLYAALLSGLPADVAGRIHSENLVSHNAKATSWNVALFDDTLLPYIEAQTKFSLKKYNLELVADNVDKTTIAEKEFCAKYLLGNNVKHAVIIKFQTPTAFKVSGEYVNFPTPHLVMQSLLNKWNKAMPQSSLEEAEVLQELEKNVRIAKYELKSTMFAMKMVQLPAFVGVATLKLSGSEPFVRILNMLLAFGEFSGVGIKTSLGMGGVEIL